jgi:hypothetical protein
MHTFGPGVIILLKRKTWIFVFEFCNQTMVVPHELKDINWLKARQTYMVAVNSYLQTCRIVAFGSALLRNPGSNDVPIDITSSRARFVDRYVTPIRWLLKLPGASLALILMYYMTANVRGSFRLERTNFIHSYNVGINS